MSNEKFNFYALLLLLHGFVWNVCLIFDFWSELEQQHRHSCLLLIPIVFFIIFILSTHRVFFCLVLRRSEGFSDWSLLVECWLLVVIDCWSSVYDCWWLFVAYCLLLFGGWLLGWLSLDGGGLMMIWWLIVGCRWMVNGWWVVGRSVLLVVVGGWWLAVGSWLFHISGWLLDGWRWFLVVCRWLLAVEYWLLVDDQWLLVLLVIRG